MNYSKLCDHLYIPRDDLSDRVPSCEYENSIYFRIPDPDVQCVNNTKCKCYSNKKQRYANFETYPQLKPTFMIKLEKRNTDKLQRKSK